MSKGSQQISPPSPSSSLSTKLMPWPPTLKATPGRRRWYGLLAALPAGLTIKEAAVRLDRSYMSVQSWAITFKYPFKRTRPHRPRPAISGWTAAVDWSLSDKEIAKLTGRTISCVFANRLRVGRTATHSTRGAALRAYLGELDQWTRMTRTQVKSLADEYGLSEGTVTKYVGKAGFPIRRDQPPQFGRWAN